MFETAPLERRDINGSEVAFRQIGDGPPVLLLHGFPQTHMMWAEVAPVLARGFRVVAPDLRGYGASAKPDTEDAASFRQMAADVAGLMTALGQDRFHLVGHDRGGRTAHRLALDHPGRVCSLTVMDIVPTHHLLTHLSTEVARAYYHWFFLAQPAPHPEQMIAADPDAFYQSCLLGWGGACLADFPQIEAYRAAWRDPETIRGMCNDYRAALSLDVAMDTEDLDRQITCPALVLYGADGTMAHHYDVPATWAPRLSRMQAGTVPGGHFFVDQHPQATADALWTFLTALPPEHPPAL